MKTISKHQIRFSVISVILTAVFLFRLNANLLNEAYTSVIYLAICYTILMFLNGLLCGYPDKSSPNELLGFIYHALTYATVNGTYLILLPILESFHKMLVYGILGQLFFWGVGLAVHYYTMKVKIKMNQF